MDEVLFKAHTVKTKAVKCFRVKCREAVLAVDARKSEHQTCTRTNGTLIRKGVLTDGFREGIWTHYHPNKVKRMEGLMEAGQRQGTWRFWHPSGAKKSKGDYQAGKRRGPWTCWDAQGVIIACDLQDK